MDAPLASVAADAPAVTHSPRDTRNNFDLIRLAAAAQVAVTHSAEHLGIHSPLIEALKFFPGVPIFFLISGFLIYQSFVNARVDRYRSYATNRVLRLYPALFLCFAVSVLSVWATGYFDRAFDARQMAVWAVTTLTAFQFYSPPFLRDYGVGAINGSLWTIAVELQFYVLTPLLYWARHQRKSLLIAGFVLLVAANAVNSLLHGSESLLVKLFGVSFLPWFYMFVIGAFLSANAPLRERVLAVNGWLYFVAFLLVYALSWRFGLGTGNSINFVAYLLLGCVVLKAAYARRDLADRLLKRNDISYGVYIYHMPVVNFLLVMGLAGTPAGFALALALTFAIAALSWFVIEKPALRLKKIALRRV